MDYIEATKDILLSVEDTRMVLAYYIRNLEEKQKRLLEKELKRPFNKLRSDYIDPFLYTNVTVNGDYGISPNPNYKEGVDDLYIRKEEHLEYHDIATMNCFRILQWEYYPNTWTALQIMIMWIFSMISRI